MIFFYHNCYVKKRLNKTEEFHENKYDKKMVIFYYRFRKLIKDPLSKRKMDFDTALAQYYHTSMTIDELRNPVLRRIPYLQAHDASKFLRTNTRHIIRCNLCVFHIASIDNERSEQIKIRFQHVKIEKRRSEIDNVVQTEL